MFLIQQDSSNVYWLSDDVVFLLADRSMDRERYICKLYYMQMQNILKIFNYQS